MGRIGGVAPAALALWWLVPVALAAQGTSPWVDAVNELQTQFTGPVARGLSLIAIVIGGADVRLWGGGEQATGGRGSVAGRRPFCLSPLLPLLTLIPSSPAASGTAPIPEGTDAVPSGPCVRG